MPLKTHPGYRQGENGGNGQSYPTDRDGAYHSGRHADWTGTEKPDGIDVFRGRAGSGYTRVSLHADFFRPPLGRRKRAPYGKTDPPLRFFSPFPMWIFLKLFLKDIRETTSGKPICAYA